MRTPRRLPPRYSGSTARPHTFMDALGDIKTFDGVWYPDSGEMDLGAFTYRDALGPAAVKSGNWWSIENSTLSSSAGWSSSVTADGWVRCHHGRLLGLHRRVLRYAWTMLQAYRYPATSPTRTGGRWRSGSFTILTQSTRQGVRDGLPAPAPSCTARRVEPRGRHTNVADSLCHPIPYRSSSAGATRPTTARSRPYLTPLRGHRRSQLLQ
jgi:hypothetical protein